MSPYALGLLLLSHGGHGLLQRDQLFFQPCAPHFFEAVLSHVHQAFVVHIGVYAENVADGAAPLTGPWLSWGGSSAVAGAGNYV